MIYIVTPVFNRLQFTQACLNSLKNQNISGFKTIIVDHGSTDGTSEFIRANFPEVILLNGDSSMWWTAATNVGIKKALELSDSEEDFILILNNDLEVDENYLKELTTVYAENVPCVVGSITVDIDNRNQIDFAGSVWNPYTAKHKGSKKGESLRLLQQEYDSLSTDLLPGRGTLFSIKVFKEIGLFDEYNFPHYAADEDFALQCSKRGYKLLVATKAVVMSHTRSTGVNVNQQGITFQQFLKSFSSIKSSNNLSIRFKWAKKNAPIPYLYFIFDFVRVFGSFFKSKLKK